MLNHKQLPKNNYTYAHITVWCRINENPLHLSCLMYRSTPNNLPYHKTTHTVTAKQLKRYTSLLLIKQVWMLLLLRFYLSLWFYAYAIYLQVLKSIMWIQNNWKCLKPGLKLLKIIHKHALSTKIIIPFN